ncbi:MAG TPA: exodeoxyribonuclease VII large subunit [Mycobacteriales bacterium]|nr:exodeoxyribonuclease VII large subunit [Mycobacteriales bacterium]
MAVQSSAEQPIPVRTVARHIGEWVARLGRVWVEGQIAELSRRPGAGTVFITLRDPVADVSLRLTCARGVCDALDPPLQDGQRVVVWAKPDFYLNRGSLALTAFEIRPVGVGALLARLEHVKKVLAAEGLFAADRKRALPFLPRSVGLICGRESAAMRDVVNISRRRWPAVDLEVREVAVQGPFAVAAVIEALAELDRLAAVDVIIVTRGGGSVEDLLPFSDESLCRAAAACRTPVVSAIGHEQDAPLLDFVADLRASTPTDAAKRVVPDVTEELTRVARLRRSAWRAVTAKVEREASWVAAARSRPSLADPVAAIVDRRAEQVAALRARSHRVVAACVESAGRDVAHARARVGALSPAATLERGYAIVQTSGGDVVRDATDVQPGDPLTLRLAKGRLDVTAAQPTR